MPPIVIRPVPVLLSVTVRGLEAVTGIARVLGKANDEAESEAIGTTPVPVRVTVCGEPVALSTMERLAVNAPVASGLKLM